VFVPKIKALGTEALRLRRLTAILAADLEGYSRLMLDDEEATLATLSARRVVIEGIILQHKGRIANTAGDSVLAEFASVLDAVRCAVEIPRGVRACERRGIRSEKDAISDRHQCRRRYGQSKGTSSAME
jgi:adenylate cyclase